MNRQIKVFFVPTCKIAAVLRHEMRPRNFPADGQVIGFHQMEPLRNQTGVALLVHSAQYPEAPAGVQLPVVNAVFERLEAQ